MFKRNKQPEGVDLGAYVAAVEGFLARGGLDPREQRIANVDGLIGWFAIRGSAITFFFLTFPESVVSVQMVAPLVHLPSQGLLPLYRRCLELNREYVPSIAVAGDVLYLEQIFVLGDTNPYYVSSAYEIFTATADELDDVLADEFGARYANDIDLTWLPEVL